GGWAAPATNLSSCPPTPRSRTFTRSVAIPVAGYETVAVVMLVPMLRNPVESAALADEMPVNPYVGAAIPAVVARSPDESGARRRCNYHAGCRWRDFNFNRRARKGRRDSSDQQRRGDGGHRKPGPQSALRSYGGHF